MGLIQIPIRFVFPTHFDVRNASWAAEQLTGPETDASEISDLSPTGSCCPRGRVCLGGQRLRGLCSRKWEFVKALLSLGDTARVWKEGPGHWNAFLVGSENGLEKSHFLQGLCRF